MKLLDLRQGDFVVLRDGYVRQILHNPLAHKTGLSLCNNQYCCLTNLDNYAENFDCINTSCFNIYKIICNNYCSDDYKTVGQYFISGTRLPKSIMECVKWDWERDESRPEFEKTNLQNGFVVTTRDMKTYMVVLNIHVRGIRIDALISHNESIDLSCYNEDLNHRETSVKDIIKVEIFNDFSKPKDRYILWKR